MGRGALAGILAGCRPFDTARRFIDATNPSCAREERRSGPTCLPRKRNLTRRSVAILHAAVRAAKHSQSCRMFRWVDFCLPDAIVVGSPFSRLRSWPDNCQFFWVAENWTQRVAAGGSMMLVNPK
jgi:hypothetical protein